MAKFNLMETMNKATQAELERLEGSKIKAEMNISKLSVFDLVPSEENFYGMTGIEELKESIKLAGRVLQNLSVVPVGDGKYKILSGHRRSMASIELVNDGEKAFEFLPCYVEQRDTDDKQQKIREEIILITSNSQREKSAWEKMEEVRRTRALVERIKQSENMEGNTRKCVADTLNTSTTQVARYDAIHNNLAPVFMAEFKDDKINISTAYELSGLTLEEQKEAFEEYQSKGEVSAKEVKEIKEKNKKPKGTQTKEEERAWTVEQLKKLVEQDPEKIVCTESDIKALKMALIMLEGK